MPVGIDDLIISGLVVGGASGLMNYALTPSSSDVSYPEPKPQAPSLPPVSPVMPQQAPSARPFQLSPSQGLAGLAGYAPIDAYRQALRQYMGRGALS